MDGNRVRKMKVENTEMPEEKGGEFPVAWIKLEGGGRMYMKPPSLSVPSVSLTIPVKAEPAEVKFPVATQLGVSDVLDVKIKVEPHDPTTVSDSPHPMPLEPDSARILHAQVKTEDRSGVKDEMPQVKVEVASSFTPASPGALGQASQLLVSLSSLNPALTSTAPARLDASQISMVTKSENCSVMSPGNIPMIRPVAQYPVRPVFLVKNVATQSLPANSLLQSVKAPAPQLDRKSTSSSSATSMSCLMDPQGKPLYIMIVKEPKKQVNSYAQTLVKPLKSPVSHICPVCKKSFTCQSAKLDHIMGVHGLIKRFCCKTCKKRFKWETSLRKHEQAVHEGVRYQCSLCSRSFTDKGSLKNHKEGIHSSVKKHVCPDCGKKFFWRTGLTKHCQAVHGGAARHLCPKCGKLFTELGSLKSHLEVVHSTERKHECPECSKKFFWKSGMQRHIAAKHSNIRYTCRHCGKDYSDKGSLRKHVASMHADLPQPSTSPRQDETSSPGSETEASSPQNE